MIPLPLNLNFKHEVQIVNSSPGLEALFWCGAVFFSLLTLMVVVATILNVVTFVRWSRSDQRFTGRGGRE